MPKYLMQSGIVDVYQTPKTMDPLPADLPPWIRTALDRPRTEDGAMYVLDGRLNVVRLDPGTGDTYHAYVRPGYYVVRHETELISHWHPTNFAVCFTPLVAPVPEAQVLEAAPVPEPRPLGKFEPREFSGGYAWWRGNYEGSPERDPENLPNDWFDALSRADKFGESGVASYLSRAAAVEAAGEALKTLPAARRIELRDLFGVPAPATTPPVAGSGYKDPFETGRYAPSQFSGTSNYAWYKFDHQNRTGSDPENLPDDWFDALLPRPASKCVVYATKDVAMAAARDGLLALSVGRRIELGFHGPIAMVPIAAPVPVPNACTEVPTAPAPAPTIVYHVVNGGGGHAALFTNAADADKFIGGASRGNVFKIHPRTLFPSLAACRTEEDDATRKAVLDRLSPDEKRVLGLS